MTSAALSLQTIAGAPARLPTSPQGSVVLFWRADCGPCLLELDDLAALKRAAAPMPVTPVALRPLGDIAGARRKARLGAGDLLVATGRAEEVLTAFGGAPPRLPLAVAFDGRGVVCGRRTGLLGYDHLRSWARSCGGARARRH